MTAFFWFCLVVSPLIIMGINTLMSVSFIVMRLEARAKVLWPVCIALVIFPLSFVSCAFVTYELAQLSSQTTLGDAARVAAYAFVAGLMLGFWPGPCLEVVLRGE